MYQKCPICKGKGLLKKEPCPTCLGERVIHTEYGIPPSKMFIILTYPTYPAIPWEVTYTYLQPSLNPQK